jgi:hypothetical protein
MKINIQYLEFKVFFVVFILLCIQSIYLTGERYYFFFPTIWFIYPNNEIELKKVENSMKMRTKCDEEFFELTDESIESAFTSIVPEVDKKTMKNIINQYNVKIFTLKTLINRARPEQIMNGIISKKVLKTNTAKTPAFPAGHASQAYTLAKHLSQLYPERRKKLEQIADKCGECRVKAGLHFPSDNLYAKLLFFI